MTNRRALSTLLVLSSVVVLAATLAAEPPPIVERAIAFHGGELYERSLAELDVCSRSGCFHVRSEVRGGLYKHTVSGTVRGQELRVRTTNDTVEVWKSGEPVEVAPADEQGYRDFVMARVYFPFLPYRLADPSVRHQDQGVVDWNGRKLHRVKVTFEAGTSTDAEDEYLYWFDPATGRLEQFAYTYRTGGGGLRFRRAQNHRRVGGILFSDQENLGAEGPDLSVDAIDPAYVAELRPVSTVRLENLRVTPLTE